MKYENWRGGSWWSILVIGLCIGVWPVTQVAGQSAWEITGRSLTELKNDRSPSPLLGFQPFLSNISFSPRFSFPSLSHKDQLFYGSHPPVDARSVFDTAPSRVPSIYAYHELAFFCRVEVKLEKAAGLPVKFRLGDVEAVERLEGKFKW